MSRKVLVTAPYMQSVIDRFRAVFDQHGLEIVLPQVKERLSEDELLQCLDGVAVVISGNDQCSEQVLRQAKNLKVISK